MLELDEFLLGRPKPRKRNKLLHQQPLAKEAVAKQVGIKVHNDGFVKLVGSYGSDASIVQAARTSYGPGTKTIREDHKLLKYLLSNGHTSPFEMVNITLHQRLPIFVARQQIRQRMARLNEMSFRYTEASDSFFRPKVVYGLSHEEPTVGEGVVHVRAQDTKNRQGSAGAVEIPEATFQDWIEVQEAAFRVYKKMLDVGVARELARACLPLSTYTEWYWQLDMNNMLKFLKQRTDSHAQEEIRDYANAMLRLVELVCPVTISIAKEIGFL